MGVFEYNLYLNKSVFIMSKINNIKRLTTQSITQVCIAYGVLGASSIDI